MKIYDISQEIFGCEVYPGDPAPEKEELLNKIEELILSFAKGIRNCEYSISPKIENKVNISCMYCPFKMVCYHEKKDEIIIEKKETEVEMDA